MNGLEYLRAHTDQRWAQLGSKEKDCTCYCTLVGRKPIQMENEATQVGRGDVHEIQPRTTREDLTLLTTQVRVRSLLFNYINQGGFSPTSLHCSPALWDPILPSFSRCSSYFHSYPPYDSAPYMVNFVFIKLLHTVRLSIQKNLWIRKSRVSRRRLIFLCIFFIYV